MIRFSRCTRTYALPLAFLVCLTLTGCSRTVWQKNGAPLGEFEQVKAACLLEGHHQVPQDNRVYLMSEGREMTTREKCKKGRPCSVVTEYAPPQYGVHDQNAQLRDQIVRACLYKNGWTEVTIED